MTLHKPPPCVSLVEMQSYVRIETGEEEAVIAGLLRVATEQCEAFIGQYLMVRPVETVCRARGGVVRLLPRPVRSIQSIRDEHGVVIPEASYHLLSEEGGATLVGGLVDGASYAIAVTAGISDDCNDIPEPLRQGIIRLAAHLYTHRDGPNAEVPKSTTALWRPFRLIGAL